MPSSRRPVAEMRKEHCPGLNPLRLVTLMRAAIERCRLNLDGTVVLTEAATGAYVVTPVLAAMAGARHIYALTRSSRYGSVEDVTIATLALGELAGVADRLSILTERREDIFCQADIVTNSGHVRPLDATAIGWMRPTAVIPLMYEAWEFRPGDVDVQACRAKGIAVVGTNERHPDVDVFSYLGIMAVKLLLDAGVAVYGSRLALLCDNPFEPYIRRGLTGAGASVIVSRQLDEVALDSDTDAIVVALRPKAEPVFGRREAELTRMRCPGAVVAQYWGEVDRAASAESGISVWPAAAPSPGHMGILPSAIGPEPIVRLQAGSLKAAQELLRPTERRGRQAQEFFEVVVPPKTEAVRSC